MLIKRKINWKDHIKGKPHKVLSRREFIKKYGKMLSFAVLSPAIYNLSKIDKTFAAGIASAQLLPTSYTMIEAAGGMGISRVFAPVSTGGVSFAGTNTATLGIRAAHNFDSTLIGGMKINMSDTFYTTLMAGGLFNVVGANTSDNEPAFVIQGSLTMADRVTQLLSKVSGCLVASQTTDDTGTNPLNNMKLIQALRKGTIAQAAGSKGRSRNVDRTRYFPIVEGSTVDTLRFATQTENPFLSKVAQGDILNNAINALLSQQRSKYDKRTGGNEALENLSSGLNIEQRAKFDPSVGDDAFDVVSNSSNNTITLKTKITYPFSDEEGLALSCFYANARNKVGAVYLNDRGWDYHNGDNDLAKIMHARLARKVLLWAITHEIAQKPGLMYVTSDGSIVWDGSADPLAMGDGGSKGMGFMLFYDPVARKPLRNIGGFLLTEVADRKTVVGGQPEFAGISAVITFGRLAGLPDSVIWPLVKPWITTQSRYDELAAYG